MADDRTKNQTNRVTEAAVDATKTGARTSADVARKGAETTQRAVEANVEAATRANTDVAGRGRDGPACRRSQRRAGRTDCSQGSRGGSAHYRSSVPNRLSTLLKPASRGPARTGTLLAPVQHGC